jgi:hypothetical protein
MHSAAQPGNGATRFARGRLTPTLGDICHQPELPHYNGILTSPCLKNPICSLGLIPKHME